MNGDASLQGVRKLSLGADRTAHGRVDLQIGTNRVCALFGTHGGITATLVRISATPTRKDAGAATVGRRDAEFKPGEVYASIGVVGQGLS